MSESVNQLQDPYLQGRLTPPQDDPYAGINSLIPEAHGQFATEPRYQQFLDVASLPARMAVAGARDAYGALHDAMYDPNLMQDPYTQHQLTRALIGTGAGIMMGSPEAEGLPAFPAWHGSRHVFSPEPTAPTPYGPQPAPYGRFMEEKMSSGEGAQAYGWGHYIAGAQGTARSYMHAGGSGRGRVLLDGQDIPEDVEPHVSTALTIYDELGGNPNNTISHLDRNADEHLQYALNPDNTDYMRQARGVFGVMPDHYTPEQQAKWERDVEGFAGDMRQADLSLGNEYKDAANWFHDNQHRVTYQHPGNLYQTWIHPEEHEMLDWDKSWDEQPAGVKEAIRDHFPDLANQHDYASRITTGEQFYYDLMDKMPQFHAEKEPDQLASEALDQAGVPGLRFLDQQSRGLSQVPYFEDHPWTPQSDEEGLVHSLVKEGMSGYLEPTQYALQNSLDWTHDTLKADAKSGLYAESFRRGANDLSGNPVDHQERTENALQWLNDNRGKLQMGENPAATRNYVMFHHRHVSVIDRNGQEYGFEPIDYNPFTTLPAP